VTARTDQNSCDLLKSHADSHSAHPARRSRNAATGGCSSQIQPLSHLPHVKLVTIPPVAQSVNPMSVTFSALMLAMASRSAMSAPRFMRAGLPAS
jgi:hypothetical protein